MKHATLKQLKYSLLTSSKVLFFLLIFFYIFLNILFSQLISPLYFQLVKEDKKAVINFLQKIKNSAYFSPFLDKSKNIYGTQIEQEVFAEDNKRKETIAKFESFLQKNPKSRDLLYNLYLLYNEAGNKTKAEDYLERAKEIDPLIEN